MGNYSSALYAEVEDFKGIMSPPERAPPEPHRLESTDLYNHINGPEEPVVCVQNEPDLFALKFLHSFQEPSREKTEPADKIIPAKLPIAESPTISFETDIKPKLKLLGPVSLGQLRDYVQEMSEELELLKIQHKREIKLLMNELDEEKKMRLSLQVEVARLKKHLSK